MENLARASQRLSIFQSRFSLSEQDLVEMRKNLKPSNFRKVFESLRQEKNRVETGDCPLAHFNRHNRFRRVYQDKWDQNYIDKEGGSHQASQSCLTFWQTRRPM